MALNWKDPPLHEVHERRSSGGAIALTSLPALATCGGLR